MTMIDKRDWAGTIMIGILVVSIIVLMVRS